MSVLFIFQAFVLSLWKIWSSGFPTAWQHITVALWKFPRGNFLVSLSTDRTVSSSELTSFEWMRQWDLGQRTVKQLRKWCNLRPADVLYTVRTQKARRSLAYVNRIMHELRGVNYSQPMWDVTYDSAVVVVFPVTNYLRGKLYEQEPRHLGWQHHTYFTQALLFYLDPH